MAWMQKQGHRWDHSTRLICRYQRLSARFELIVESEIRDVSVPADAEITVPTQAQSSRVNQADSEVTPLIVGAWSQLVLRKHYRRKLISKYLTKLIESISGHYSFGAPVLFV